MQVSKIGQVAQFGWDCAEVVVTQIEPCQGSQAVKEAIWQAGQLVTPQIEPCQSD